MRVESLNLKINPPDISEVKQYMRAGGDESLALDIAVREEIAKISCVATPKACFVRLPIDFCDDGVKIGSLNMQSESLKKRLIGCEFAYIFAATVGYEVDRVVRASSIKSGLLGLAADASGSAAIEEACDSLCEIFSKNESDAGYSTKTRFSCGYGDLSIEYQGEILDMLDAKKNIGVTLTLGGMMTPTKTVTAIVGVKRADFQ